MHTLTFVNTQTYNIYILYIEMRDESSYGEPRSLENFYCPGNDNPEISKVSKRIEIVY